MKCYWRIWVWNRKFGDALDSQSYQFSLFLNLDLKHSIKNNVFLRKCEIHRDNPILFSAVFPNSELLRIKRIIKWPTTVSNPTVVVIFFHYYICFDDKSVSKSRIERKKIDKLNVLLNNESAFYSLRKF